MTHSSLNGSSHHRRSNPGHPESLGVARLEPHEVTEVIRVRGEGESVTWFKELSAEQRGTLVSQLHDIVGSLKDDAALPEVEQPMVAGTTGRGGKSTDARFDKTTLYLTKTTKLGAQRQLLGTKSDLSILVNLLLNDWLKRR
jgi:hypothetical protein